MSSFFQKLQNLSAKVDDDVEFITRSLARPKSSIPSHQAASRMNDELGQVVKQAEQLGQEVAQNLQESAQIRRTLQENIHEMDQNLNLIEQRLGRLGIKAWQKHPQRLDPASMPNKLFLSPNANTNQHPDSSPIMRVSPRMQTSTLSSSTSRPTFITSSTPVTGFTHFFPSYDMANRRPARPVACTGRPDKNGHSPTVRLMSTTPAGQEPRHARKSTPEEPVLLSELYLKNKNGKNSTPDEPTLTSSQYSSSNRPTPLRSTPEEPVLQSERYFRKKNGRNITPEEPILTSGYSSVSTPLRSTPEEPVLLSTGKRLAIQYENPFKCPSTPEEPKPSDVTLALMQAQKRNL